MPNRAYNRSTRREREIVNDLRRKGFQAARSAGSKSPWDVWSFDPVRREVRLIQVKTRIHGRGFEAVDEVVTEGVTVITATYRYS